MSIHNWAHYIHSMYLLPMYVSCELFHAAKNSTEEGGFTGANGTYNGHEFTFANSKIEIVQSH